MWINVGSKEPSATFLFGGKINMLFKRIIIVSFFGRIEGPLVSQSTDSSPDRASSSRIEEFNGNCLEYLV